MRLLLAGNDITVIALWLGNERIATTNIYLHALCRHRDYADLSVGGWWWRVVQVCVVGIVTGFEERQHCVGGLVAPWRC